MIIFVDIVQFFFFIFNTLCYLLQIIAFYVRMRKDSNKIVFGC